MKRFIYTFWVALLLTLAVVPLADGAYNVPLPLGGDSSGTTAAVINGKINGTSVPAGGALTTGNAAYVSGASAATYSALNLAGGAGWVTGLLPIGNLGVGTAGQIPVTNAGATADVFVTVSGDETMTSTGAVTNTKINGTSVPAGGALTTGNACYVSGSSACTYSAVNLAGGAGWVTGTLPAGNQGAQTCTGDVTGTTAASVVSAISGSTPINITPASLQWLKGTTAPSLLVQTQTTDAAPPDLTISAGAPFASAVTNLVSGSVIVKIPPPVSGNANGFLRVNSNNSSNAFAFGGATNSISSPTMYLGVSPLGNNFAVQSDGSTYTYFNAPVSTARMIFGLGQVDNIVLWPSGLTLYEGPNVGQFGGGSEVLSIGNATTMPTTVPTTAGILAQDSIGLHYDGSSTSFNDYVIAPTQQGAANSQAGASRLYSGVARTTTNTAVTALTIPIATSGTSAMFDVNIIGRDVSAGTVGDTFAYNNTVAFKNVAGTVTAAATQGTARTAFDASMSTSAVTYVVSGTNILVKVNGLASVNVDWTAEARAITN